MEPVRDGQELHCTECGVQLRVIKACDDSCTCNITCCGKPLQVYDQEVDG